MKVLTDTLNSTKFSLTSLSDKIFNSGFEFAMQVCTLIQFAFYPIIYYFKWGIGY